jgi:hypothetical protein
MPSQGGQQLQWLVGFPCACEESSQKSSKHSFSSLLGLLVRLSEMVRCVPGRWDFSENKDISKMIILMTKYAETLEVQSRLAKIF